MDTLGLEGKANFLNGIYQDWVDGGWQEESIHKVIDNQDLTRAIVMVWDNGYIDLNLNPDFEFFINLAYDSVTRELRAMGKMK